MTTVRTHVFINPKAGGGKAARLWPELAKQCAFLNPYQQTHTEYAGHLTQLTREALKRGGDHILVIGGDGSLSEAVNGFFEAGEPINPQALLGTIPLGSGSDFLKSFGAFDIPRVIERLKKDRKRTCDVGEVTYRDKQNQQQTRLFLNISSFGCSGAIVDKVNRSKKRFGAKAAYFGATASVFLTYKNPEVTLEIDFKEKRNIKMNNLFVCNGKFSGGGMCWGPRASPTDGLLDLTVVKALPKFKSLLSAGKIYNGRVYEVAGIERIQCRHFTAASEARVPLEVDGDTVGQLPVTFRVFPRKINLWY